VTLQTYIRVGPPNERMQILSGIATPMPRHNTRLERTRHERVSLLSCVGEPLKRNVGRIKYYCRGSKEESGSLDLFSVDGLR
jgi:hypothetical protein